MKSLFVLTVFGGSLLFFSTGCNPADDETDKSTSTEEAAETGGQHGLHGGWWCGAHGVPEEDCSMCSSKAANRFKVKGDWCDEHNRAESQCFECDASRAEKFAQLYEAKFGEKPPARTD